MVEQYWFWVNSSNHKLQSLIEVGYQPVLYLTIVLHQFHQNNSLKLTQIQFLLTDEVNVLISHWVECIIISFSLDKQQAQPHLSV